MPCIAEFRPCKVWCSSIVVAEVSPQDVARQHRRPWIWDAREIHGTEKADPYAYTVLLPSSFLAPQVKYGNDTLKQCQHDEMSTAAVTARTESSQANISWLQVNESACPVPHWLKPVRWINTKPLCCTLSQHLWSFSKAYQSYRVPLWKLCSQNGKEHQGGKEPKCQVALTATLFIHDM